MCHNEVCNTQARFSVLSVDVIAPDGTLQPLQHKRFLSQFYESDGKDANGSSGSGAASKETVGFVSSSDASNSSSKADSKSSSGKSGKQRYRLVGMPALGASA